MITIFSQVLLKCTRIMSSSVSIRRKHAGKYSISRIVYSLILKEAISICLSLIRILAKWLKFLLDRIEFNIPGSGPHTIQVTSALPEITDPVVIDGYTQAGASQNTNGADH